MGKPQKSITLKTVLHEVQEPGRTFSLKFRTLEGNISIKTQVKKNPGKAFVPAGSEEGQKNLKTIQRNMTNAGALLLYDCGERHPFEAKIELLQEFNGYRIFHNY